MDCHYCNTSLPFKTVLKVANDRELTCPNCHKILIPNKTKSWAWGAIIGFLSVILPSKVISYYGAGFLISISVGAFSGMIGVGLVALYIYRTTTFR